MKKLLEIKNLKRIIPIQNASIFRRGKEEFAVHAVDGIDLDIYENEILALVGESGCGKSTFGKMLVNLNQPTEGSIIFDGKDLSALSSNEKKEFCKQTQIIFQDIGASLNPRKTVDSILTMPFRVHFPKMQAEEIEKKVKELLCHVGLNPPEVYLQRYPHEFSGGQRQRIGIARAIALAPKFIVADEPVSALDVSVRGQILNLLKDVQKEFGLTYLFITHDLSVVRSVSDRVAVMYLGKIVELSSTENFFDRTLHPYAKAILSATPIADPQRSKERNVIELQGEPPSPVNIPAGCRFHMRCIYAKPICSEKEPCLCDCGKQHYVACHLYTDANK